jgi:RNA polymerase sigma-70 factor, ECF subfamily
MSAGEWDTSPPPAPSSLTHERLRRGEAPAIAAAYDQHHARLRTFARRLVGDDAAAEDLVQEVFITLPSAIRRLRDDVSLESFLMGIAINHARHHLRAAARRRRALARLDRDPRLPAPGASPEQQASAQQLATVLASALDRLPLAQRVAFVLCDVEERSSIETARLVGVPEATVRTRLHHARRKLREHLAAEGYHDAR